MNALVAPFELTDAELDLVTGGNTAVAGLGLANISTEHWEHQCSIGRQL